MSLSEIARPAAPAQGERRVELHPITTAELPEVAQFLHDQLDPRVPVARWVAEIVPSWTMPQPNHGYLLRCDGAVVGTHLAFYSEREIEGTTEHFCNLAGWCVAEPYRSHALGLLRALLRQKSYHFTDLSPTPDVLTLNSRLGFVTLDTSTVAVPNLPRPVRARGIRVFSGRRRIEKSLQGHDLAVYRDHARAAAARHVVITRGEQTCHVIFRRVRRKNIRFPLFASLLYVSDPDLFRSAAAHFFRHLLIRHAVPATVIESHVVDGQFPRAREVSPNPKMYRSESLRPDQIDYLYSELTNMRW
ncbi:hypothetical protein ACQI4F_16485 [Mycolicibacterium vaccae]|uniref:hypothetical protein n=1 Tax=Mycolicibacterium vaccae TaxID=1810 RepID=UPI003CFAACAF